MCSRHSSLATPPSILWSPLSHRRLAVLFGSVECPPTRAAIFTPNATMAVEPIYHPRAEQRMARPAQRARRKEERRCSPAELRLAGPSSLDRSWERLTPQRTELAGPIAHSAKP